jgi:putative nucleotidyltransferase with HDIG domain
MKQWLNRWFSLGLIAALSVVLTVLITQPTGAGVSASAGSVAKETYKSPRTVTYKSDIKTAEAEKAAEQAVSVTYRKDLTAASQQESKVAATFGALSTIRGDTAQIPVRVQRIQQVVPNITPAQAETLLRLDDQSWQQTQAATAETLRKLQGTEVKQSDLGQAEALVTGQLPGNLSATVKTQATLLGQRLLIPNELTDEETTKAAQSKARNTVEPIRYTVERDQVIAYRGQVLSDFDVERLAAVGLTRPAFNWQRTLGIFLLVTTFSFLLIEAVPRFARRVPRLRRLLGLLSAFAFGLVLIGVLIVPTQPILAYVTPVAAPALLLAIFYGRAAGLVAGVSLVSLFALAAGGSFELYLIHLAAIVGVVTYAGRIRNTRGFIVAGALSAGIVFVAMTAFALLAANFDVANVPKFALAAGLNGALLSTFVFAGAAFLGGPMGTLTFLQLLELESPRQPLLRRLASETPGTYSHSLRMAGLVENVAKRIGADPLLARVQALYHDIGKVALPEYFIENQGGGANPHQGLSPKESAELLRAHISEGLELAREAGLPEVVTAVIPEHHGTTLMRFFWEDAKKGSKRPVEADFRYLGPKPQSRETALVMMADAVEAASRSIEQPDEQKITDLVKGVFADRLSDGQFDDTPLTTRQLGTMQQAFIESILADRHRRIRYPGGKPGKKKESRGA